MKPPFTGEFRLRWPGWGVWEAHICILRSRHILNSEDVNNSLVMIQPTLMSYGLEQAPEAVLLDSISIQPDTVLLLDTFFHILIFHGETVAAWRKAGYHEQEGYENLAKLLQDPQDDAQVREPKH